MIELDEARRNAVARLCRAQASGLISVNTFEDRYALVRQANSVASLDAIVADMDEEPVEAVALIESRYGSGEVTAPVPVAPAESIRIGATLGSAVRAGTWTVPEHLAVMVILGEVTIDFRDATFTTDTVVIDIGVTFGSLKIIVPPGTQIENECEELFASSTHPSRGRGGAPPNGILLVLRGHVRFGELNLKERPPTGQEQPYFKPFFGKLLRKSNQ
jgi:hypothetical protein